MSDIIFKGATRPPMMLGIPIIPFILVAGMTMILTMWGMRYMGMYVGFIILTSGVCALFSMKMVSKHDNQKLNQLLMQLRDKKYRANSAYWNSHSISPIDFTKR